MDTMTPELPSAGENLDDTGADHGIVVAISEMDLGEMYAVPADDESEEERRGDAGLPSDEGPRWRPRRPQRPRRSRHHPRPGASRPRWRPADREFEDARRTEHRAKQIAARRMARALTRRQRRDAERRRDLKLQVLADDRAAEKWRYIRDSGYDEPQWICYFDWLLAPPSPDYDSDYDWWD
jgi:hypothetical protein